MFFIFVLREAICNVGESFYCVQKRVMQMRIVNTQDSRLPRLSGLFRGVIEDVLVAVAAFLGGVLLNFEIEKLVANLKVATVKLFYSVGTLLL